jgi:hypothetical protein
MTIEASNIPTTGVNLSDTTPANTGTTSAGTGTEASRNDHIHALESIVKTKLATAVQEILLNVPQPKHSYRFENNSNDEYGSKNLTENGNIDYSSANKKFGSYAGDATGAGGDNFSQGTLLDDINTIYTKGVTFEFWFRPTNVSTNGWIMCKFNKYPNGDNGFEVMISSSTVRFSVSIGGVEVALTSPTLSNNTWYHIACIHTRQGYCYLYLDGVLVKKNETTHSSFMPDGTQQDFFFFANHTGGQSQTTGQLDSFNIYDNVLTPQQIWNLYKRTGETLW